MRLFTVGAGLQSFLTNYIMHDLALKRIHRLEIHRLTGFTRFVDGIQCDIMQTLTLMLKIAVNVHDEVRPFASLLLNRQTGELLQGIHHFPIAANQMLDISVIIGNNLYGRAIVAYAHLNIAFIVDDIQQFFKIIGSDISFFIELIDGLFIILRHGCVLL